MFLIFIETYSSVDFAFTRIISATDWLKTFIYTGILGECLAQICQFEHFINQKAQLEIIE
jgi:hypothetical protein